MFAANIHELRNAGISNFVDIFVPSLGWNDLEYVVDGQYEDDLPYYADELKRSSARELWARQDCTSHGCVAVDLPCEVILNGPIPPEGTDARADYELCLLELNSTGHVSLAIDATGIQARAQGLLHLLYGLHGLYYYEVANYEGAYTQDPKRPFEASSMYVSTHDGNGEGWLVYPGTPSHVAGDWHSVLASTRLKALRDGLEDYEIARKCLAKNFYSNFSNILDLFDPYLYNGYHWNGMLSNVIRHWPNPESDGDRLAELDEVKRLLLICATFPGADPDIDALSPPIVEPPVECTDAVRVSGVLPGATVRVGRFRQGAQLPESSVATADDFGVARVVFGSAFVLGDRVYATQEYGSLVSASSGLVDAIPAPDSLPTPRIIGPLIRCARVVEVAGKEPFSTVEVSSTWGLRARGVYPTVDLRLDDPNQMLIDGDDVQARQVLECPDRTIASDWSDPVTVLTERDPHPPVFEHVYSDHNRVGIKGLWQGANLRYRTDSMTQWEELPVTADRRSIHVAPMAVGEKVYAEQYYCDRDGEIAARAAIDCSELPALRVYPVSAGDEIIRFREVPVPGGKIVVKQPAPNGLLDTVAVGFGKEIRFIPPYVPRDREALYVYYFTAFCDEASRTVVTVGDSRIQ